MRVGIFFDGYLPGHEAKDPGQLVLGLLDAGASSEMTTQDKPELRRYRAPFPLRFVTRGEALDPSYWRAVPDDAIIAYTWLNKSYLPVISAMRQAGKVVIVKADSDGRLASPLYHRCLYPSYLRRNFSLLGVRRSMRRLVRILLTRIKGTKASSSSVSIYGQPMG